MKMINPRLLILVGILFAIGYSATPGVAQAAYMTRAQAVSRVVARAEQECQSHFGTASDPFHCDLLSAWADGTGATKFGRVRWFAHAIVNGPKSVMYQMDVNYDAFGNALSREFYRVPTSQNIVFAAVFR